MSAMKEADTHSQSPPQEAEQAQAAGLFLERLRHLGRGERAALRRNAGRTIAESRHAASIFYRLVPKIPRIDEEIYFLVAALYGFNDQSHAGNLGDTMRDVQRATGSDSIDRRMSVLLDAEFDLVDGRYPGGGEMAYRLLQAVKLAAGRQVGVNWRQLLLDLLWWTHPSRQVQKRWARTYFSDPGENGGDVPGAEQPSEEGGH
ncbi:MAG: type I-E CRISPR-associated protein Cse2/CasB [Symbiobacteriia bacterium]